MADPSQMPVDEQGMADPSQMPVDEQGMEGPSQMPADGQVGMEGPSHMPAGGQVGVNDWSARECCQFILRSFASRVYQDLPISCYAGPLHVVLFLLAYLAVGIIFFVLHPEEFFNAHHTHPFVDAFYFTVVTLTTVGFGDIYPTSGVAKICCVWLGVIGYGFFLFLLCKEVTSCHRYVFKLVSRLFRGREDSIWTHVRCLIVVFIIVIVILFGGLGGFYIEGYSWEESFYLSAITCLTIGYGDISFITLKGRIFASLWIPFAVSIVSVLLVYIIEHRLEVEESRNIKQLEVDYRAET